MNKANETYDFLSPFPRRFSALMLAQNVTQKTIAEVCGVRRQSVSEWMNGNTRPDILSLIEIAKYFNVSTDYLLGLTDYKTNDKATRELCSTLGLSEEAVKILSADHSSVVARQWKELLSNEPFEELGHTEEECREIREGETTIMIDGISAEVGFVFNRLIDDFIRIQSINMRHADDEYFWAEQSLIELLADFYDCTDTAVFETHVNGQSVTLPSEVFLSGITREGKKCYPVSVKELLINSYIGKITTRLQHIKQSELLRD